MSQTLTNMIQFPPFDPLQAKSTADTEVAVLAQKREIKNILSSYVGWYDPFSELIQNSLDSIEERAAGLEEDPNYEPTLWITINIQENWLSVTDNGTGLTKDKFEKFLCPDISFKSGNTRGHKGVGATYLAYGFNFTQVATKTPEFTAVGKMTNARIWLDDENPVGNPTVQSDEEGAKDPHFNDIDKGVSIFLRFDRSTNPKDLKWIVADTAESWFRILSVKTGLGAFNPNTDIKVWIKVIDRNGSETVFEKKGIEYYWTHLAVSKAASIKEIKSKEEELFALKGRDFAMPARFINLDTFYERWGSDDLITLMNNGVLSFNEEDQEIIAKHTPEIYASYVYSAKVWDRINEDLNVRVGSKILYGGIQLAANNMPQGETIQIPLVRYIGRQNQIHFVFHFDNCNADLGRKGFQSEVVEFAKETSRKIADTIMPKIKYALRANTGEAPNLLREAAVENWKRDMEAYEGENGLSLENENFFFPIKKISITSKPSREQDVIALFNQLLAGGVIRGLRLMGTNERLTYDGLYRIIIEEPSENHIYNRETNPLGVDRAIIEVVERPFKSHSKIIEYKFSLDGLIEDIEDGTKNSNDINLIVVWETGDSYKANYKITSLLDENNLPLREYHGVTHTITNINSGQREMDLIVLSELIEFLNDPAGAIDAQIRKYED